MLEGSCESTLLAGYGWSKGRGIGLNSKDDVKHPNNHGDPGQNDKGFVRELYGSDLNRKYKQLIGCLLELLLLPLKGCFWGRW